MLGKNSVEKAGALQKYEFGILVAPMIFIKISEKLEPEIRNNLIDSNNSSCMSTATTADAAVECMHNVLQYYKGPHGQVIVYSGQEEIILLNP